MDPIGNGDRLLVLLRQRLLERTKAKGKARGAAAPRTPAPPAGLDAVAALDGADTSQLRRACIQALLADQIGPSLINDAHFQQIVSRVTDAIAADADAARLLDRIVGELRPS